MADKRNIVIKVKYPVTGKLADNMAPKMVTEWNVKRVSLAAGILVLILATLFYLISSDMQDTDSDNTAVAVSDLEKQASPKVEVNQTENISSEAVETVIPSVNPIIEANKINTKTPDNKEIIKKQPNKKVINGQGNIETNPNVSRALLTYKIYNKEPTGEVVGTVDINSSKPVWVYYFNELKAMKGKTVHHEWFKNGAIVTKHQMVISGDSWRTSSRKLLSASEKGNWVVRLVDEKGRVLNEKKFKVE
jgi:hypothetical protein